MSHTTEDLANENSKKKSDVIKNIRLIDKGMREKVRGLPLFKLTFKRLRDLPLSRVLEIESWFCLLSESGQFKTLSRIYNENSPEYWQRIPNHLEEHVTMRYRRDVFVTMARNTMPEELHQ